jgi:E1A/CREB-binding protein
VCLSNCRFVDPGELPDQFPYRAKALFAFEEVDGTDVCFFGMHVQEYGSECPTPNTRRVYIAYLDSVHFFRPRQFRTAVYHEILLGYLDYVKQLGYTMAHIWACPPSEGDDYIFHCHPPEQKIPKPKRLQEWYKKMLDKGIIERIVLDYKVGRILSKLIIFSRTDNLSIIHAIIILNIHC